jgi:hypothetical protein
MRLAVYPYFGRVVAFSFLAASPRPLTGGRVRVLAIIDQRSINPNQLHYLLLL